MFFAAILITLILAGVAGGLRIGRNRHVSMFAVLALAPVVLAGCGHGTAERNVVKVRADEYAYLMPDRIRGGVVTMEFSNTGRELHELALARLAPGVAPEDIRAELSDGDGEAPDPKLLTDVGGVPLLSPGRTVTVTRELLDGTYLLLCFVPAPDGKPHIHHGMLRSFDIAGNSGDELPRPDAVIVAREKRFELPKLKGGRQTIELRNSANGEREFFLMELRKPGTTFKDPERWDENGARGPAPAIFPGGMQSIPPGTSVFEELEFEPGREYLLTDEHGLEARFRVGR